MKDIAGWIKQGEFTFSPDMINCVYKGRSFYTNKDGYFQLVSKEYHKGDTVLLHRLVYEENFGKIPHGFIVHHKDRNKKNNTPENLETLSSHDHAVEHSDEIREVFAKCKDKAHAWIKSDEGRKWCREVLYPQTKDLLHKRMMKKCVFCGKEFEGNYPAKYCSSSCRGKAARANEDYFEMATCEVCGKNFKRFKYGNKNRGGVKRTCSRKCAAVLSDKTSICKNGTIKCVVCGNNIPITCGKVTAICSNTCYSRWYRHKDRYLNPIFYEKSLKDKRRSRYK